MEQVIDLLIAYITVLVDMQPGMTWQAKAEKVLERCNERTLCAVKEFSSWFEDM